MNTQINSDERNEAVRPLTDSHVGQGVDPADSGQTVDLANTGPATLRPDQTGDGALQGGTSNGGTSGEQATVGATSLQSAISAGGAGGDTEPASRTATGAGGLSEIAAAGNIGADRSGAEEKKPGSEI